MSPVSWIAVGTVAATLPPAGLAWLVWRRRSEPGARPYAVLLGCIACWTLIYALTLVVTDPAHHELLLGSMYSIELAMTGLWAYFAIEYTGRGVRSGRLVAVVGAGLAVTSWLLVLTNDAHGLVWTGYRLESVAGAVVSSFQIGPWFALMAVIGFGFVLAGLGMLLEMSVADSRRYGRQTITLALAASVPSLAIAKRLLEIGPYPLVDFSPMVFALFVPLLTYCLANWDLFAFTPATRRVGQSAAIEDLGDAVLIVDESDRVVDLNDTAASLLEHRASDPIQTPIEALLGEPVDLGDSTETIRLETARGHREFGLATSPIEGMRGDHIGHTVVLHDITDEKQRRQRFEVLNRVLRHNLRNGMNAIMGFSTRLEEHTNDDAEWMLERIQRQTAQVVELSERASAIDRVTSPTHETTTFAVRAAFESVADRLGDDHPDATVTVHVPDGLEHASDRVVVEEVLRYAGSSLLAYNGANSPRLVLAATPTDGERPWIDVSITSNGNPVPPDERAVIERGEETPLDHSRHLDLWLVAWGVETLGGDLSFLADDDRPGVQLRLPDLRAADGAGS